MALAIPPRKDPSPGSGGISQDRHYPMCAIEPRRLSTAGDVGDYPRKSRGIGKDAGDERPGVAAFERRAARDEERLHLVEAAGVAGAQRDERSLALADLLLALLLDAVAGGVLRLQIADPVDLDAAMLQPHHPDALPQLDAVDRGADGPTRALRLCIQDELVDDQRYAIVEERALPELIDIGLQQVPRGAAEGGQVVDTIAPSYGGPIVMRRDTKSPKRTIR